MYKYKTLDTYCLIMLIHFYHYFQLLSDSDPLGWFLIVINILLPLIVQWKIYLSQNAIILSDTLQEYISKYLWAIINWIQGEKVSLCCLLFTLSVAMQTGYTKFKTKQLTHKSSSHVLQGSLSHIKCSPKSLGTLKRWHNDSYNAIKYGHMFHWLQSIWSSAIGYQKLCQQQCKSFPMSILLSHILEHGQLVLKTNLNVGHSF